jgi:3'-5' exoribonuclease
MPAEPRILRLCELVAGQQADCFALLAAKERALTRDGKPYYRATFRDKSRSAVTMIWSGGPWFTKCESEWRAGQFYKLRCTYSESAYGPQLELERVREVQDADRDSGFDPQAFFEQSRFDVAELFQELVNLAETQIEDPAVRRLVVAILQEHESALMVLAAAVRNHHAFAGGWLEHVLSVARTCVYLADKYLAYYPNTHPRLSKSLVVAGAILHDIGKVVELNSRATGSEFTAQGRLIGHILLGRDMVREKALRLGELDPETLLRLEHVVAAHQDSPEWGSPVAPQTLEALLVHYADDLDAKYHMMARALEAEPAPHEEFTSGDNPLKRRIFRGLKRS